MNKRTNNNNNFSSNRLSKQITPYTTTRYRMKTKVDINSKLLTLLIPTLRLHKIHMVDSGANEESRERVKQGNE